MQVYLDYAATTPLDPEIEILMRPYHFIQGNPSSVHRHGAQTRELLEDARERVGKALGTTGREIIFTSGGTEADNQAIFAFGLFKGGHIVTTSIEHSAVLTSVRVLETMGRCQVTFVQPDKQGLIDPNEILKALRENTILVSVMHVNNEIGTIQDIRAIAEICESHGVVLHVDAVQSPGLVPLNVKTLGCDLLTISSHKFYGPKGVGALFCKRGLELSPFLMGGHQEGGLRGGTHNLPGIIGMSYALEKIVSTQSQQALKFTTLSQSFIDKLLTLEGLSLNGASLFSPHRSPKHISITAQNTDGESLLMNLDIEGVSASSGSACNAGTLEPSHVLLALGHSYEDARASIRFSLGQDTTSDMLDFVVSAFAKALARSRL